MKPVDWFDKSIIGNYPIVELLGNELLFSDIRIKRDSLPECLYAYDLRHEDENWGKPCQIQKHVLVNYFGTVITNKEIDLEENGYIDFDSDKDFWYTEKSVDTDDLLEYFGIGQ